MSVTKEDLGGSKVRLTITVPAQTFQEGIEKAYRKRRSQFVMPGFRKGNVPRAIVEKQHGPEIFYQDALELVLPASLEEALTEANLTAVSQPENISVQSWNRNDGVVYKADMYVKPEVALGPYEGLVATEHVYKIRDVDVDEAVESVREQNVRWVPVERPAQNSDTVVIDFVGKLDGEPFEGGSAEHYRVTLGSNRMIDGFEEQIVGMAPGEDRTIEVTFPENYHSEDLAGKPATFDIHVSSVEEKELSPLDDDFAEDVSDYKTLEEFRAHVREDLQKTADRRSAALLEGELVSQVVNSSTMIVPPPMVERQIDEDLKELHYNLLRRGVSMDQYLERMGVERDQLASTLRGSAQQSVRTSIVLEKLIEELGTQATDEEMEHELREMAEQSNITLDEAKNSVPAGQLQALADRIAVAKVLERLKEMANITVVEEETAAALFGERQDGQTEADNETAPKEGSSEDTNIETPEEQN